MQVTQVQDHVTHAVINSQAPITFGISESAEFFQILSSNLYSDQILAVVRETLCNAWDAHIEAGCTDKPIKVTIDNEKLTIRDFGNGIHYDQMGPLYGTYGGTNKRNDGRQTGGFGLGCKAPFAYADHFEVESHHEGTRTLYAISKSSAELQGKPGIVPIVSFPTTETGLEVGLLLKDGDHHKFRTYLQLIAGNGEMNVEVNDERLKTLPLSKSEFNWIITTHKPVLGVFHSILVRYGNVIYPVLSEPSYRTTYKAVREFLHKLSGYGSQYAIIFQAPPHSISVTPSRESLSMQEHTIKTLTGLLGEFTCQIGEPLEKEFMVVADEQISVAITDGNIGSLLTSNKAIPGLVNKIDLYPDRIQTLHEMARVYATQHYPTAYGFYHKHLGKRLDAVLSLGFGKRGHLQELKKIITTKRRQDPDQDAWFKHRIVRPLVRDLQSDPVMDPKRMFIHTFSYRKEDLKALSMFKGDRFSDYIELQRNIVVLSYSMKDIGSRVRFFPEMKKLGGDSNVYVYHAPLAKTKVQAMRDFFIKRGFILLDMTTPQVWDPVKIKRVPSDTPKKVKLTGYPALSGVFASGRDDRIDNCFIPDAPRVENPIAYVFETPSKASHRRLELYSFNLNASKTLVTLFGDECAVVSTSAQVDKLKLAGVPPLDEFLVPFIIKEITTTPEFLAYWPDCMNRAMGELSGSLCMYDNRETLFKTPEIRTALGLQNSLDKRGRRILKLWNEILNLRKFTTQTDVAKAIIRALPVSQAAKDLAATCKGSNLIDLLDLHDIQLALRRPSLTPDHLDRITRMVIIALKG